MSSAAAPAQRRSVIAAAARPSQQLASQALAAGLALGITLSGAPALAASPYSSLADIVRPQFAFVDEDKNGAHLKPAGGSSHGGLDGNQQDTKDKGLAHGEGATVLGSSHMVGYPHRCPAKGQMGLGKIAPLARLISHGPAPTNRAYGTATSFSAAHAHAYTQTGVITKQELLRTSQAGPGSGAGRRGGCGPLGAAAA